MKTIAYQRRRRPAARHAAFALALALVGPLGCSKDETTDSPASPDSGVAPLAFDFAALETEQFKGAWKTEGVVVMHDGKVVYEKYAAGYDAGKRHLGYSVSKSVGSALVGIAVAEGLMKLEESVCTYFPAPTGAAASFCDTTIDHLLHMSSGLGWTEEYADPKTSNVLPMLYGDEKDTGEYVARRPRAAKAGEAWLYSSGDSNLLARALRGALGGKDMRAWAKEKLFVPAGLSSVMFEADRSGTLLFSSSCFMTPRDMAKFGQLYLDDGMSGGVRVLPSSWITYTKTPAPPVAQVTPRKAGLPPGYSGGSYGGQFWLNAAAPTATADTFMYPQAPVDAFAAEGHWGQKIVMVPSRKLVIARVGNDRTPIFDPGPMVGAAVSAIDAATKGASR